MSTSESSSPREQRINEILADYLEAVEKGPPPDRESLLARRTEEVRILVRRYRLRRSGAEP